MKLSNKIVFILLLFYYPFTSYSQNYWIINKNEEINLTILNDSLQITIKNKSDKSIFLPVENILKQNCSTEKTLTLIEFGIDLVVFNEFVVELEELKPKSSKIFKSKLIDCNYNYIHFIYEFYLRSFKNIENKIIYSIDITQDENWLMNGDWEWGELIIELEK